MHTLLIADTNAYAREPLCFALQHSGYLTLQAETPQEICETLEQCDISAVIMSLELPQASTGLQAILQIKQSEQLKNTPLLLCAEHSHQALAEKAQAAGIDSLFDKQSFCFDTLLTTLTAHGLFPKETASPAQAASSKAVSATAATLSTPRPTPPPKSKAKSKAKAKAPTKPVPAATQSGASISDTTLLKSLPRLLDKTTVNWIKQNAPQPQLLPNTVKIVTALDPSDADTNQALISAAEQDPGLCLRLISSAHEHSEKTVGSPAQAIQLLGINRTLQLATDTDLQEPTPWGRLDPQAFWEHSIATAIACRSFAELQQRDDDEKQAAYLAGLLHDTGRQILLQSTDDGYQEALETADMLNVPLPLVEKHMFTETHASLMECVLRRLGCRSIVCTAVGAHHDPLSRIKNQSSRTVWLTEILCLANRLIHGMLMGDSGYDLVEPTAPLVKSLGFRGPDIAAVLKELPKQVQTIKRRAFPDQSSISTSTPKELATIGTLYAGLEPEADEVCRLTSSLLPGIDADLKLVVAHIRCNSERQAVNHLLKQQEAKLQITNLPAIIVSPKGDAKLEDNRPTLRLASPVSKKAFIKAALRMGGSRHTQAA